MCIRRCYKNSVAFTTEFDSFFSYSIVKTESRIEANIYGSHTFISGDEPIFDGSMYANVYRNGSYVDKIDLLTTHNLDSSTFMFDYSPIYFGSYYFELYVNDPYFSNPQLICNATFNYEDPNHNPDPEDNSNNLYEGDAVFTLPLAFGMVGVASLPLLGMSEVIRSKLIKKKRTSKN